MADGYHGNADHGGHGTSGYIYAGTDDQLNIYHIVDVVEVKLLNIAEDDSVVGQYLFLAREHLVSAGEDTDYSNCQRFLLTKSDAIIQYFDYHHYRYVLDNGKMCFKELEDLSSNVTCRQIHDCAHGITPGERRKRLLLYGHNVINIEVKSYFSLLFEEVLTPFYIFQIGSIALWLWDQYYYYAGCIFLISAISIAVSLYETRKQRVTLKNMMSTPTANVLVADGVGDYLDVCERDLVPGDVMELPLHGCAMNCDAVLIAGTCIVNESMLTGESVPVTKTPLVHQDDEEAYSPGAHKRHTLFAGTRVVQTRYYGTAKVLAVVVRTGYCTAKGELVSGILFPKPLDLKFYQDSIKFILFLALMASLGMIYSLIMYIRHNAPVDQMMKRLLDIVTIIVPPALPAAMTVGTVYAQSRLKKQRIYCISPPRINFCGRINVFCFDKTGTLTEDGLDMWGVVPAEHKSFHDIHHIPSAIDRGPLLVCLATCHSLTIIDGELSGDPLDLIMFNATKWNLEEPGRDTSKFDTITPTVVRPCTSDTFFGEERMSVITRTVGHDHMQVYSKGAPEKIASLCLPDTVPDNFHHILHKYTIQGLRVIALAFRRLDSKVTWHQVQRLPREKVESDLNFLGLLILQNQLKPESTPVIGTLHSANIRTVMVTGDMVQTAISVARNCGMVRFNDNVVLVHGHPPDKENPVARLEWELVEMAEDLEIVDDNRHATVDNGKVGDVREMMHIGHGERPAGDRTPAAELPRGCLCCDSAGHKGYHVIGLNMCEPRTHLALTGRAFLVLTQYFPELLPKVCVLGTIFARMSPEQKCSLIEHLQEYDYIVGMCGDGANDCEALKAAHAGISLSEAEASVAAPFTSRVDNIECVVTAMKEGRAALVTSFGCFKYMALYSFIQFISVLILYTLQTNLSDLEFLYIDLVITTTIAILFLSSFAVVYGFVSAVVGYTGAFDRLVARKPSGSLVKVSNIMSILVQVLVVAIFQLGTLFYLMQQMFYHGDIQSETETDTWPSTVIFITSTFMYIGVAFSFSKGPPFRKPLYTNVPFLSVLIALYLLSAMMLLYPMAPVERFMDMKPLHELSGAFRYTILAVGTLFLLLSWLLEWLFVDSGLLKQFFKLIHIKQPSKYKLIASSIAVDDWPPVGDMTYASPTCISGSVEQNTGGADNR